MTSNDLYQAQFGINVPGHASSANTSSTMYQYRQRMSFRESNYGRSDSLTLTEDLKHRSQLSAEFGIANKGRSLSCFLNVVLQTLWSLPIVRMNLIAFCDMQVGGPKPLQPLINSL